MVAAITNILSMNGIRTLPEVGCPIAKAEVLSYDNGLVVIVEDPEGRLNVREVIDHESAASIIESWVRTDLAAHMLSPRTQSNTIQESDHESPKATPEEDPNSKSAPEHPSALIDLGFELGVGFDGSTWLGGAFSGCVVLGPTCLGAALKFGSDPAFSGDSELFETNRMIFDLLAVVDFPFFMDKLTLRPGIEAGAVFLRISKVYVHENIDILVEDRRWDLAVGAHFIGALTLGRGLSILAAVSVAVLPTADTSSFIEHETSLAGSPRGMVRFLVGLEYQL